MLVSVLISIKLAQFGIDYVKGIRLACRLALMLQTCYHESVQR